MVGRIPHPHPQEQHHPHHHHHHRRKHHHHHPVSSAFNDSYCHMFVVNFLYICYFSNRFCSRFRLYDITAEANPMFLLATRVDKMSPSCPLGNAHSNRSRARKNIGLQSVHVFSAELCLTESYFCERQTSDHKTSKMLFFYICSKML